MNQLLIILAISFVVGNLLETSNAQVLSTRIRIQSCADNSFLGVAPKNGPPPVPTTTTTTAATTVATATTVAGATTTAAPAPVVPVPGGGGSTNIVYWKVNWANSVSNATGSAIASTDTTTQQIRCLGKNAGADINLGVVDAAIIQTESRFIWNFISVFDSVTWTYRYRIVTKESPTLCLQKSGAAWTMATCSSSLNMLFNLLS